LRTYRNAASAAACFSFSSCSLVFEELTIASIYSNGVRRASEKAGRNNTNSHFRVWLLLPGERYERTTGRRRRRSSARSRTAGGRGLHAARKSQSCADLRSGARTGPARAVGKSVRIGITREVDRRFRFYERGNPCVSGPARNGRTSPLKCWLFNGAR